ncbi:MAG: hypothetical protein LBM67_05220 [Lentimicrobiaceae bacterium]|jgi:thiol-disulfide isomerase/thioredoxin|nr:hypothetical protein [Lentimicrobiaceae bacterium]
MKTLIVKIIFVVFFLLPLFCSAQEEQLYFMHQKAGTEKALQHYVQSMFDKESGIVDTLSVIYINFIPPMGCPRCEGILAVYQQFLQKLTSKKAFVVNVLVYEKEKALASYIRQQDFQGNRLYVDTTDRFVSIFHVNSDVLMIPYLTKINLQHGRLITAVPALGIDLNESLVDKIVKKTTLDALYTVSDEKNTIDFQPVQQTRLIDAAYAKPKTSLLIAGSDTLPVINKLNINQDGNKLLIDNFITNSFVLYSKEGNCWTNPVLLRPSEEEKKLFISKSIPISIYDYLNEVKVLASMYLNASFTDTNLYVIASLPKLMIEIVDSVPSVAYYNMPIYFIKDTQGKNIYYNTFDDIELDGNYVFSHSEGSFFEEDTLFAFKLQKGWPAVGTEALPQEEKENPFLQEFYHEVFSLLFYNANTKSYTLTAPLDPLYETYKLGYYTSSPFVKSCHRDYYWVDTFIGKVYRLSNDLTESTLICDFFSMDTLMQQMPYSENLTYLDSYRKFFNKKIVDFEISDNDHCYAIVFDEKNHYLNQTKGTTIVIESLFPEEIDNRKLTTLQFGNDELQNRVVYGLYQNNRDAAIYLFDL